jgi:decaprenylphospho-beta-D-ribofuranose 2-oxidase
VHSSSPSLVRRRLTGWGRTSPALCDVLPAHSPAEIADALASAPERGVLPRGLGRSYGDLAQNGGGVVIDMTTLGGIVDLDADRGIVTARAGCSLARLLDAIVPAGWFLPVTPGTRDVTVGGAIACDIHGKNHHRDGALGQHVVSLTLLDTRGEMHTLSREATPAEFDATVGGLGLTGVVLDATLRLLPIETTTMRVDVERTNDIEDTFARLTATDHLYRYSVAWIDGRARGRRLGRSILLRGDHAGLSELPAAERSDPLAAGRGRTLAVPSWASVSPLLRGAAGDAFNELYFRRAREGRGLLEPLGPYFYPLDALQDWNRLYGRAGFLQYQFAVPFGCEREVVEILRLVSELRPVLGVLKRFGEESGPLSFPLPGWTLALDIALPVARLGPVLDRADEIVAQAGGRVYLAKDVRLREAAFAAMYPRLDEWRRTQARLDPDGRMRGDLARRLRVTERQAT